MVNYRRSKMRGGTYFFTLTLKNRQSGLLIEKIDYLKASFHEVKTRHPFKINAYVILPDHMHVLWTLPDDDNDYSLRWQKIKTNFSKSIAKHERNLAQTKHGEYMIWQRRFWEHAIKDNLDYENHVSYIHYNPIKHGLVQNLAHWPFSSFHQYVKSGRLPPNWSGHTLPCVDRFNYGE